MKTRQELIIILHQTLFGNLMDFPVNLILKIFIFRIQSSRAAREYIGKGAFGACRHLIQTEGFLAFYKGLTPILLLSAPRVTLQYTGLAFFLPKFEVLEQRGYIPPRSASAFAGICTGMSQAVLLITPLE